MLHTGTLFSCFSPTYATFPHTYRLSLHHETKKQGVMKYFKSYPCQYEDISKLPLDVLEDIMIRIGKDLYLNGSDKSELLNLYIEQRWWKKQKSFFYSKENIARIEKINQILIRQTTDVMTSAWEICQQEGEENKRNGKKYSIKVEPKLLIPNRMFGFLATNYTHKDAKIWWILANGYNDSHKDERNVLPSAAEYGLWKEKFGFEEKLKIKLWGVFDLSEPEKKIIAGIDDEKTKHIRFCWPFTNLLSQQRFALQDILSIEKFTQIIEVKYDVL